MNQDSNIEVMLTEAIALAKAGNRANALSLIRQVLAVEPNNITALLWQAYSSDNLPEVQYALNRVLALDPTNEKALEWQNLIEQQTASSYQSNALNSGRDNQTKIFSPLATTTNTNKPTKHPSQPQPVASIFDPTPTLSFTNWQQNMAAPAPFTPQMPSVSVPDYNIREIHTAQASANPFQIVIQVPDSSKNGNNQGIAGWLIGVMIGLAVLIIAGITFVLINQNGGLTSIGKPDKAAYRGFSSVDDLLNSNLESHQRVDLLITFDGGYTTDADGNLKIPEHSAKGNGAVIISWNPKEVPINNFHSGQSVRVYGTVEGIGNTITLYVEQASLERS